MQMRIAIVGAGGVGGYFGARLIAAGADVRFVARGAHLDAMLRGGLSVKSAAGDLTVKPVRAAADAAAVGPVDLVMIAVKVGDTPSAIEAIRPLMQPGVNVVSVQNGVEAISALTAAFGVAPVIGGVAHISAEIAAPGVIKHTGTLARLTIGEPEGVTSARVTAIVELARKAGVDIVESADIKRSLWEKFIFLSSFSGVTALARRPAGVILGDPDLRAVFAAALDEAVAVAQARGAGLAPDQAAKALAFSVKGLPAAMKSSMLVDLERGNRLEVEYLSGTVARLGAEAGVPTPTHRAIYAALKPFAGGDGTR